MLIRKLFRKTKRIFDFLIGDKSDEICWRYKFGKVPDIDLNTEIHPYRKLLLKKITQLNSFNSILEVGCANGLTLRMIDKKIPGIDLEGIDINKKFLSEGVNILKRENISNIRLKYQNAKNLGSYDTGQFDVVFCYSVLMYIGSNNVNQVLEEMVRISKKSVIIAEQHTNGNSFYDDKWIHNYDILLKNISGIQSVIFHSISDDILGGDWTKYGKIIVIKKNK